MKRLLLSVRPEELATADALAARFQVPRTEVFRRGLAALADQVGREEQAAARRKRLEAIAAHMDEAAKILAKDRTWDPIKIIRACREGRDPRE